MLTTFDSRRGSVSPVLIICLPGASTGQSLAQSVTTANALTGGALPERNGGFISFVSPALNAAGQVACATILKSSGGGAIGGTGIDAGVCIDSYLGRNLS